MQIAPTNRPVSGCARKATTSPNIVAITPLVIEIDTAALAQLKATIRGLRLKRSDESNASIDATMIAADAP